MITLLTKEDAVKVITHMDHNSLGEFHVFVAQQGKEDMTREYYDQHLAEMLSEFLNQ